MTGSTLITRSIKYGSREAASGLAESALARAVPVLNSQPRARVSERVSRDTASRDSLCSLDCPVAHQNLSSVKYDAKNTINIP